MSLPKDSMALEFPIVRAPYAGLGKQASRVLAKPAEVSGGRPTVTGFRLLQNCSSGHHCDMQYRDGLISIR
jgi:hypothetical protein